MHVGRRADEEEDDQEQALEIEEGRLWTALVSALLINSALAERTMMGVLVPR